MHSANTQAAEERQASDTPVMGTRAGEDWEADLVRRYPEPATQDAAAAEFATETFRNYGSGTRDGV